MIESHLALIATIIIISVTLALGVYCGHSVITLVKLARDEDHHSGWRRINETKRNR